MAVIARLALLGLLVWLAMSAAFKVRHQLEFRSIVVSWGASFAQARLAGIAFPVVEGTLAAACVGAMLGALPTVPVLVACGVLFSAFGAGQAILRIRRTGRRCGCTNATGQIGGTRILRSGLSAAALFAVALLA